VTYTGGIIGVVTGLGLDKYPAYTSKSIEDRWSLEI